MHSDEVTYGNRLPQTVVPNQYDVHINLNHENMTFDGQVTISVAVNEATSEITLHSLELHIKSVEVDGVAAKFGTVEQSPTLLRIVAPKTLEMNSAHQITIAYDGKILTTMSGLYSSSYTDMNGLRKSMFTTQFEPCDARRMFPCWDEPSFKAVFKISCTATKDFVALSNMPVEKQMVVDEYTLKHTFEPTPVMSTYLVALALGDFGFVETKCERYDVRVFTIRGEEKQGRFALDVAVRVLKFFEEYFHINYPLPKMDLLAVPDFAAGAMENWGLVTYRSVYLLYNEATTSLLIKRQIAFTVAHELAHQWFGNLVTMKWWNHLWLNEGFATWAGATAIDYLYPQWFVFEEFLTDEVHLAMSLDCMKSSHQIEVPVTNTDEIGQIFDSISYSKGASVIRMLADYLGDDFTKGLRSYLATFKYGNASTRDLWEHLTLASGQNVSELMRAWTQTVGFPLLNVSEQSSANGRVLTLTQQRFTAIADKSSDADDGDSSNFWPVPVTIAYKSAGELKTMKFILNDIKDTVTLPRHTDFFKLNDKQMQFYRVLYPVSIIQEMSPMITNKHFDVADRFGIVSDIFALSENLHINAPVALDVLEFYRNEDQYIILKAIASGLSLIYRRMYLDPQIIFQLDTFIVEFFEPTISRLGFDFPPNENDDKISMLRVLALSLSGRHGNQKVILHAISLLRNHPLNPIHPDIRGTVYTLSVIYGTEDDYNTVYNIYLTANNEDDRLSALSALGSVSDPVLYKRSLYMTVDTEVVRPNNLIYLLRSLGLNPVAREATWEFVKEHWSTFHSLFYNTSPALLQRIVTTTTSLFTSLEKYEDVKNFFDMQQTATIQRAIDQSLESISMNARFYDQNIIHFSAHFNSISANL